MKKLLVLLLLLFSFVAVDAQMIFTKKCCITDLKNSDEPYCDYELGFLIFTPRRDNGLDVNFYYNDFRDTKAFYYNTTLMKDGLSVQIWKGITGFELWLYENKVVIVRNQVALYYEKDN